MDIKIVVALISIAGIALGILASGLGYFYKVRSERLKTTKETLYYLLEFRAHFMASSCSPRDLSQEYISICEKFFRKKGVVNTAPPPEIIILINQMFQTVVSSITPNISNEFLIAYETSLKNLSKDNPVLAYKLRGKEAYSDLFDMIRKYNEQLSNLSLVQDDIDPAHLNKQISDTADWGFNEHLGQTDADIARVAKRCDLLTRWEVRKILKKKDKPVHSLNSFEVEAKLELVLENLLALKSASPCNTGAS
ncbi:hypothetical protein H8F10_00230 [Vibrio fluvialis]|uniref:hypothetical protein n=1 Tax=Vibrio fluvialis TaxID=676 RepID=UPI00192CC33A|nr:hypothetical protein [Vibrio fluvialis]MBL4276335.1 hypothetical protein [Vibrio fluvialis]